MPLWDTLYRWLCHHGTPYVDRYIIKEHPMYMLFHCGGMIFKVPYTSLKAPGAGGGYGYYMFGAYDG